ncbi:MAG: aminopeptidase P family protein [Acidimicrobiia bacterium]|nr:aminopeptidase P family protein [Acidimicrobiia bacterium]
MQNYPRFSTEEMLRRRLAIESLIDEYELDAIVVYGANRAGSAIQWISEWPVTREAALIIRPGRTDHLYIQFYNHVPTARILAKDAEVQWGGPSTTQTVSEDLHGSRRVGLIGPIGYKMHAVLKAAVGTLIDLDGAYTRLRMIKSAEEIDWLRLGARLSDQAITSLRETVLPGMTEQDLGAIVEAAYLAEGGTNHIHYFGVTSMSSPDRCVPAQYPTTRTIAAGDILTTEISASWWGYPGQVLRSMTIGAEPTDLYVKLHDVADAAFDAVTDVLVDGATAAQVIEAASVIEAAGFTIYDDLVHGFGGGYFQPIVGSASRMNGPLTEVVFEAGMTVVVQPNVITPDELAGVQTGQLVLITKTGVEQLHQVPRGLWRA